MGEVQHANSRMHLTPISAPIFGSGIGKNDQVIAALIVSNIGSTSLVVVKSTALRIARSAIQMRNTEHRTPTGGVHQPTLMLESHRVPDTSPTSATHEQNSGGATTRPARNFRVRSPAGESAIHETGEDDFSVVRPMQNLKSVFERSHLACSSQQLTQTSVVFILHAAHMPKSVLDPHELDLLLRARQGYTQRMLQLYLQHEKRLRISQPSLSRWLAAHTVTADPQPQLDDDFRRFQSLAQLGLTRRTYRSQLARWRGHIKHLRNGGHSLGQILTDLRNRGVSTSIRSIRRVLKNGEI